MLKHLALISDLYFYARQAFSNFLKTSIALADLFADTRSSCFLNGKFSPLHLTMPRGRRDGPRHRQGARASSQTSTLSHEVLDLELTARHLATTGSRADRERRLSTAVQLTQQQATTAGGPQAEVPTGDASSAFTPAQELRLQELIRSAITPLYGISPASAPPITESATGATSTSQLSRQATPVAPSEPQTLPSPLFSLALMQPVFRI